MTPVLVPDEETVINIASLKRIERSSFEIHKENAEFNVDISKGKFSRTTQISSQDSVTLQVPVAIKERVNKGRIPKEICLRCKTTGTFEKGKTFKTKFEKPGRFFVIKYKRPSKRMNAKSSQYKGRFHLTAVKDLKCLLTYAGLFVLIQTAVYGKEERKFKFSGEPMAFWEAKASGKLFIPQSNKEHMQLMNFVARDITGKGNKTWYPAEISSEGINWDPRLIDQSSKQCRFYDLKRKVYENINCYRPMLGAMCFIKTENQANDGRCKSIDGPNGTAIRVCRLGEAPSFHGAYQTCLHLGGTIWPVSKWPLNVKTEIERRSGFLHYWDSSGYKILLNGSEVTFYINYAKSLDSTKMCTTVEPKQRRVNSADCNKPRFYVIEDGGWTNHTEKKPQMVQSPTSSTCINCGWAAFYICLSVTVTLTTVLIILFYLNICVIIPNNKRRQRHVCCMNKPVTTVTGTENEERQTLNHSKPNGLNQATGV